MTKIYAIYSKAIQTEQRDALLALYPQAADYGGHYLFPMSHEQATGEASPNTVDLSQTVLVDSEPGEGEMSLTEFDTRCDAMLAGEKGREVILSVQQGRYLKESRFALTHH